MSWSTALSTEQELLIQLFSKHFPNRRLTNIFNHTLRYDDTLAFPEGETRKKANNRRQQAKRAVHPNSDLDSFEPYYHFKPNRFIDELIQAHQNTNPPLSTMPRSTRSQRLTTTPTKYAQDNDDEDEDSVAHSFHNENAARGSDADAVDDEVRIVTARFSGAGISPSRGAVTPYRLGASRGRYAGASDIIQLKMGTAGNKHDITVVDGDLKKFGDGRGWSQWCHIKLPIRSALDYDKYTLKIHLHIADGCS